MHEVWKENGKFEMTKQNSACQLCSILKNRRLTETEIQQ